MVFFICLPSSARRLKENVYFQLKDNYNQIWETTCGRNNFDYQRMERYIHHFGGHPIRPLSKGYNGATIVIRLPEDISAKIESLKEEIKGKLKAEIPDLEDKLYFTPKDALHITVFVTERIHEGPVSPYAFSEDSLSIIREEAAKISPFKLNIEGVNLTSGGVIILEGYVAEPQIFDFREALQSKLKFAPPPRYKFGILHVTLARFLRPISDEEFRKIVSIISEYRNRYLGQFLVDELVYAHIITYGLENDKREELIPLGKGKL